MAQQGDKAALAIRTGRSRDAGPASRRSASAPCRPSPCGAFPSGRTRCCRLPSSPSGQVGPTVDWWKASKLSRRRVQALLLFFKHPTCCFERLPPGRAAPSSLRLWGRFAGSESSFSHLNAPPGCPRPGDCCVASRIPLLAGSIICRAVSIELQAAAPSLLTISSGVIATKRRSMHSQSG